MKHLNITSLLVICCASVASLASSPDYDDCTRYKCKTPPIIEKLQFKPGTIGYYTGPNTNLLKSFEPVKIVSVGDGFFVVNSYLRENQKIQRNEFAAASKAVYGLYERGGASPEEIEQIRNTRYETKLENSSYFIREEDRIVFKNSKGQYTWGNIMGIGESFIMLDKNNLQPISKPDFFFADTDARSNHGRHITCVTVEDQTLCNDRTELLKDAKEIQKIIAINPFVEGGQVILTRPPYMGNFAEGGEPLTIVSFKEAAEMRKALDGRLVKEVEGDYKVAILEGTARHCLSAGFKEIDCHEVKEKNLRMIQSEACAEIGQHPKMDSMPENLPAYSALFGGKTVTVLLRCEK